MNSRLVQLIAGIVLAGAASSQLAFGQEPQESFRSVVQMGPRTGAGTYRFFPGRWNLVRLRLSNRSETEVELQSTAFLGDDAAMKYGRVQWIPPQSAIETAYPIWIPASLKTATEGLELQTQLSKIGSTENEVLVHDDSGKLTTSDLVRLNDPLHVTGVLAQCRDPVEGDAITRLVDGCRKRQFYKLPSITVADSILPEFAEAYDNFHHLVVADDRLADDESALTAVRQWLASGGRMWIHLDQVAPLTVESLLGESWPVAVVGQTDLSSFTLSPTANSTVAPFDSGEFELPVPMVRVLAENVDVAYQIDGWPAAFWLNYGAGRVLVTTLGARGWLPADREADQQPIGPIMDVMVKFLTPGVPQYSMPQTLQPVVQGMIGYAIPSRGLVVGLLSGFVVIQGLVTAHLWRRQRLEQIGVYLPVCGLIFGGTLVGVGLKQQRAVEPTVAQLQIVEPLPSGDALRLRGLAAQYVPDRQATQLSGTQGGRIIPDLTGLTSTNRRLIWTDSTHWRWEHLVQPAGLRLAEISGTAPLDAPLMVDVSFGSDGPMGKLSGPIIAPPEDAVLMTPTGRIGVTWDSAGHFTTSPRDVLGRGQFVAGDILSDAQRRRGEVLKSLAATQKRFPGRPALVFWSPPFDGGFNYGPHFKKHVGEAMVLAPLNFYRPVIGTEFTIPAPFIEVKEGPGPEGLAPRGLFDARSGEWQERAGPAATWLELHLPPNLGLVEISSLTVVVRVAGPLGRLQLSGWQDGTLQPLHTWEAPVGTLTTTLTELATIPLADDGTVSLFVQAGLEDPSSNDLAGQEGQKNYWRIESFDVSIKARTVTTNSVPD